MKQLFIVSKQLGKENWLGLQIGITASKGSDKESGATQGTCPSKILDTLSATSLKILTGGHIQQSLHANFSQVLTDRDVERQMENQLHREEKHT